MALSKGAERSANNTASRVAAGGACVTRSAIHPDTTPVASARIARTVRVGIRRLRTGAARAALARAAHAAREAGIPALTAEVESASRVMDAPAARLIAEIETMHMTRKGQLRCSEGLAFTPADEFYSLATR